MATKRKPYIRIARSVLHEPWPDDVKLTLLRLTCFMADRWATDQLTAEQACTAVLSRADLFKITGTSHPKWARHRLRSLGEVVSISIRSRGDFVEVYWSKLAEYQGWDARERGEPGVDDAPNPAQSAPSPSPAPKTTLVSERETSEKPPQGSTGNGPDPAPPAPLTHEVASSEMLQGVDDVIAKLDIEGLVTQLGGHPGTKPQKRTWLKLELPLIVLEVMRDPNLTTERSKTATLLALVFRYYRAHLKHPDGRTPGTPATKPGYETAEERNLRRIREMTSGKPQETT